MSQQKGHRDFSDIDHLDRATESFMREQRKALEGYRPPRARRNRRSMELDLHRLTKIAAIAAVFAVIVGTVIFAGIRFGERGNELRQPQETTQAAVTDTAPAETTTAAAVTDTTAEQTSLPTTASTKVTTARTNSSETQRSSSLPIEPSSTSSTTVSTTSEAQRAVAENSAPRTTVTTTRTTTSTTRTTTTSTSTTSTAKRTTTRTTTSTTRTTTRTTTTSTSTSTSTTAAPKAIITITGATVGGWEDYNNHEGVIHYVTITVRNDGNATLSGSQQLKIYCDGSSIIHASCTSGNTTSIIMFNGETLYVPYNGRLAPGATDTIVMRVIAKSMFLDCDY